ncbi:hypothetical protein BC830DRAFT_1105167 [Chytriomyces sp. MP71]|nr:hypothetical protein BC830DRAFT_1105167 [Chytriomyces sp. MP71]
MSKPILSPSVVLFSLSAILTIIAVGSYGWFYVSYPKYEGSYGVFYVKGCSSTFCQSAYLMCEHAWYCSSLKAFRAFAVLSALFTSIGAALTFYYMGFLFNKPVASKRIRLIKVSSLLLMISSAIFQFLTIICWGIFKYEAGKDFYDDFSSTNGTFGFSYAFIILAFFLTLATTTVFYFKAFRSLGKPAQIFNGVRFGSRSWRDLDDAIRSETVCWHSHLIASVTAETLCKRQTLYKRQHQEISSKFVIWLLVIIIQGARPSFWMK